VQRILGIDLGATAVKAVAIESSFRTHTISAFRAEPVPPQNDAEPKPYLERIKPVLEALAQDEWFQADSIVCSLPAAQVAVHLLSMPFTDRKQIDATLPGQVEDLIPFNLEDVVYDWHVLQKLADKTEIMVAVALKRDIQAVLDTLKSVGVDPSTITFSAAALGSLSSAGYLNLPVPEGSEAPAAHAIVDVGADRTNVAIVDSGQVLFARTISVGGNDVTRALARGLQLSSADAEERKKTLVLGAVEDPTESALLDRAVAGLVRELRATFSAFAARTKKKVERIALCGGASRLAGLDAFLAESLGITVEPLRLKESAGFPQPEELQSGALALGLGLRAIATTGLRLNFRKGEFAFTKNMGEIKSLYTRLAAMAAILFLLAGVSMWAKLSAIEKREAALDETLCKVTEKILGKCETDYRVALGKLKGSKSPASAVPAVSAVEMATAIGAVFPAGSDVVLTDLDIVDTSLHLRGDAKGYGSIDELESALKSNKCMQDVHKGKLTQSKDGRVEFSLDATYSCTTAKKAGS
jgi:general secretion pathway protein L